MTRPTEHRTLALDQGERSGRGTVEQGGSRATLIALEKVEELNGKELLSDAMVREVVAKGGLDGSTKSVGLEEGLDILARKNDVWISFAGWYETLGAGERRYMDLILEAASSALGEPGDQVVVEEPRLYEDEIQHALAQGDDLEDPTAWGPVSTAITREIIRRTIQRNCATRWAGC